MKTALRQMMAVQPCLRLDFLGSAMDSMVVFTRATTAAWYDSVGLVEAAASGAARFEFNPSTLAARGLLFEDGRTNICLRNSVFSNAAWSRTTMTVGADTITDPAGTTTYDTLTASGANATCLQSITVTNGSTYTFSIDLVRVTGAGTIQITMDGGTTWTTVAVTGMLTRFSITGVTTSTTAGVGFRIVTSGDAIGAGGAQLELGEYVSSRLSTAGASSVRNRDQATVTLPSVIYTDGFFASITELEVQAYSPTVGTRVFRVSDSGANNAMTMSVDTSNTWTVSVVVNGAATTVSTGITATIGVVHKIGTIYGPEGMILVVDGVIYRHLIDRPTPQNVQMTAMNIGPPAGAGAFWLRRMTFWHNYMAPEKLSALTAA